MKTFVGTMLVAFAVVLGLELGQCLTKKQLVKRYTDKYSANKFVKSLCDELVAENSKCFIAIYLAVAVEVFLFIVYLFC